MGVLLICEQGGERSLYESRMHILSMQTGASTILLTDLRMNAKISWGNFW